LHSPFPTAGEGGRGKAEGGGKGKEGAISLNNPHLLLLNRYRGKKKKEKKKTCRKKKKKGGGKGKLKSSSFHINGRLTRGKGKRGEKLWGEKVRMAPPKKKGGRGKKKEGTPLSFCLFLPIEQKKGEGGEKNEEREKKRGRGRMGQLRFRRLLEEEGNSTPFRSPTTVTQRGGEPNIVHSFCRARGGRKGRPRGEKPEGRATFLFLPEGEGRVFSLFPPL